MAAAALLEPQALGRTLSCIISHNEETQWVVQHYGPHSWQTQVVHFLHSLTVQIISMALLVLDIIIIIVELYLDMEYPACHIITRDATSCCNASHYASVNRNPAHHSGPHATPIPAAHHRFLEEHPTLCNSGLTPIPAFTTGCDAHKHSGVHVAHDVMLWMSVVILSLFALEMIILFAIERLVFLRNPLYVFDVFIISAALSIEIYLYSHKAGDSDQLSALAGLLVLARSWRFVRIGHAIFMVNHKQQHSSHEPEHGQDHPRKHAHEGQAIELADPTAGATLRQLTLQMAELQRENERLVQENAELRRHIQETVMVARQSA